MQGLTPRVRPGHRNREVAAILAGALLYGQARNFPAGIDTACRLQLQGKSSGIRVLRSVRHPVHDHERAQDCETRVNRDAGDNARVIDGQGDAVGVPRERGDVLHSGALASDKAVKNRIAGQV